MGNSGEHSFRYTDGIGMEVLGSGGLTATGINDFGQVSGTGGRRAVRYTDGVGWEGLGVLPGAESSSGVAINNLGQVTGYQVSSADGFFLAFRYTDRVGMEALGVLMGGSYGRAINNRGQVAGFAGTGGVISFRYTDGIGIHALGELPYPFTGYGGVRESVASGINDMGQVVGWACIHDELGGCDVRHGFLYTDALGMVDLNALIPSGSDWILASASDINNRGQIVGRGLLNGQDRAFHAPLPVKYVFVRASKK